MFLLFISVVFVHLRGFANHCVSDSASSSKTSDTSTHNWGVGGVRLSDGDKTTTMKINTNEAVHRAKDAKPNASVGDEIECPFCTSAYSLAKIQNHVDTCMGETTVSIDENSDSKEQLVACPKCALFMPIDDINDHLDECFQS
jgi:hypothetical protein